MELACTSDEEEQEGEGEENQERRKRDEDQPSDGDQTNGKDMIHSMATGTTMSVSCRAKLHTAACAYTKLSRVIGIYCDFRGGGCNELLNARSCTALLTYPFCNLSECGSIDFTVVRTKQ